MNIYKEHELRKMPIAALRSVVDKIMRAIAKDAKDLLPFVERLLLHPESEQSKRLLWDRFYDCPLFGGRPAIGGFIAFEVVTCLVSAVEILHQKELDELWLLRATKPLEEGKA